jgi:hypothetical protein
MVPILAPKRAAVLQTASQWPSSLTARWLSDRADAVELLEP